MTRVAKAKSTEVVTQDFAKEMEDLRSRLQAPSGDKIKVDNKQFKLPNGDSSETLSCIIVDFVYYNAYYDSPFDPNQISPPACFAISTSPTGATPSANSPDVQNDSCNTCWANQFGSAGKGKACRNSILVAVLPPDADENTPLMLLNVSPTGIKSFTGYLSALVRMERPPYSVLTDVFCDPNVKYDSLRFSNPQEIDDGVIELVRSRRSEARDRLMVEPDVTVAANDSKKPAAKGRLAPAAKRRTA
jgi:hypothetical protein